VYFDALAPVVRTASVCPENDDKVLVLLYIVQAIGVFIFEYDISVGAFPFGIFSFFAAGGTGLEMRIIHVADRVYIYFRHK
jgi:hypothetical protein